MFGSKKQKFEAHPVEHASHGLVEMVPADRVIAEWYKKIEPMRVLSEGSNPDFTIKKCIPVLDALTTGYFLVTRYDAEFGINEEGGLECKIYPDNKSIEITSTNKPITMHPWEQIRGVSTQGIYREYAFKWTNPYLVTTPPGYSCIFTHPFNQVSPFLTLTGVVETDSHPLAVQFPFMLLENFTGTIPSGTPIVQIIPFLREDWKKGSEKLTPEIIRFNKAGSEMFDRSRYDEGGNVVGGEYKKKHRVKKKYS
jgi:hypothetical protein